MAHLFPKLATLALISALSLPAGAETPDITGHWRSVAPETQGQITATREFRIDATGWSVTFRAHADAGATMPLFRLEVSGVYVIGGLSTAVPDAHEAIFPATRRVLTAESPAGVALFAGMGCALVEGEPMVLSDRGCGFVPGLMQAMGEYDLVAVRDGQLFFGDRAGDLTRERPAALTPFPLVRQ